MPVSEIAIKSLRAYYENITEINFTDDFVKKMLESSNSEDVYFIESSRFHEVDNLNFESMESFYRENFVTNLIIYFLGDYEYPFDVLKLYLSDFNHIDELKNVVFLRKNIPNKIDLLSKYKKLTIIFNKGLHTEKLVCDGESNYIKEISEFFIKKHKKDILISYLNY